MPAAINEALTSAQAEEVARANRDAAVGMPLAQVAAFHIDKIQKLSRISKR